MYIYVYPIFISSNILCDASSSSRKRNLSYRTVELASHSCEPSNWSMTFYWTRCQSWLHYNRRRGIYTRRRYVDTSYYDNMKYKKKHLKKNYFHMSRYMLSPFMVLMRGKIFCMRLKRVGYSVIY
jgi:hypothetical protein